MIFRSTLRLIYEQIMSATFLYSVIFFRTYNPQFNISDTVEKNKNINSLILPTHQSVNSKIR